MSAVVEVIQRHKYPTPQPFNKMYIYDFSIYFRNFLK